MNVRDEDPMLAEFGDRLRALGCEVTLHHYRHNDGRELGRIRPFPANEFWISAESFDAAREHAAWLKSRRTR